MRARWPWRRGPRADFAAYLGARAAERLFMDFAALYPERRWARQRERELRREAMRAAAMAGDIAPGLR